MNEEQSFFYGIEFDGDVVDKLVSVQDQMPVEWTKRKKPTKLHMTLRHLKFHWEHSRGVAPKALSGARGLYDGFGGPFEIKLDRLGEFPRPWDKSGAFTYWLGPDPNGPLMELAQALAAPKSFTPHVTLGFATGPRVGEFKIPISEPIVIPVNEVVLFGTTDGPDYEVVERFLL